MVVRLIIAYNYNEKSFAYARDFSYTKIDGKINNF